VTGGSASVLVPHPDGALRALHTVASPESWFEDFGSAALDQGTATVRLDPDFAAVVDTSSYHVFLTEYGDSNGLFVSGQSARDFTVQERQGGTSSTPFHYRVVARRKDVAERRLLKVSLPADRLKLPLLQPPAPVVPLVPAQPALPPLPSKLGLGVYDSGGSLIPTLEAARPSLLLLMDPAVDFAQEVRRRFPKAFIVGRVFVGDQPLDNPTQRGIAFAERVAARAVPLKGVVDAWMGYNEVAVADRPADLTVSNTFQVAFAHRLQDTYGIAAVACNDSPRSLPASDYPKYFAEAIQVSRYVGIHSYPNPGITSLRDPQAAQQMFFYREIKAALDAASIPAGPFLLTEVGLCNGWKNVTTEAAMAQDFLWYADQIERDPYVLGMCIYGVFGGERWSQFNVANSTIPQVLGTYKPNRAATPVPAARAATPVASPASATPVASPGPATPVASPGPVTPVASPSGTRPAPSPGAAAAGTLPRATFP
jgi:hypothetical protein